jgi:retron-type reverse transcriptase
VEFDIRGLFDNLAHDLLMAALRKHCQEPWILLCGTLAGSADANHGRAKGVSIAAPG